MTAGSDRSARTAIAMRSQGFEPATGDEIAAGRDIAARLVGEDIATAATMQRVHDRAGGACFILRDAGGPAALFSLIPLAEAARPLLAAGRLEAIDPPDAIVAAPGDPVIGLYVWGAAGLTWRGRKACVAAALALTREAHPDLPLYAKAASSDGERVLQGRLGARPLPGGDLAVAAPFDSLKQVA